MKKYIFLVLSLVITVSAFSQRIGTLQQRKLINAFMAITNLYVDSVQDNQLVEVAIKSMLKELDPHSSYTPSEEYERMNAPLQGSFEGIGVQFQILEDTLLVVQTIPGAPAEKVGVLAGDRMIYIGEELIAGVGIQNSDIMKKLRGRKGTEVTVKIKRGSLSELLTFKITRDKIPIHSVDASYMVAKNIGYIKINKFGATTVEEFHKAFGKLRKAGMKNLILSLKGNGGGYLRAAHRLADEFLLNNQLVVYTQGLRQRKSVMKATSRGDFETGKLIVLVDEYSASASEIVSGALQDWDRAVIVGRRTFGKGLVQRQLTLEDKSVMRLTTARYYTPTGRCIQKPYKNGVDYEKDITNRYKHGEFLYADSIHFPDSLRYETLKLKRTVYGGGGIMPDVFVPLDTTRFTLSHRKIIARGVLNKVSVHYIDQNRAELKKKYKTFEKFNKKFVVDEHIIEQIKLGAEKEKIEMTDDQFEFSKSLIKLQIKALVARDLWDDNEYYQVMNEENESLKRAVQILQTKGEYEKILKEQ